MSQQDFERFRDAVLDDPALQSRLRQPAGDAATFVARVVAAGAEQGYQLEGSDVEAAMAEGRRAWLERWVR
jgi:hypothetical protein